MSFQSDRHPLTRQAAPDWRERFQRAKRFCQSCGCQRLVVALPDVILYIFAETKWDAELTMRNRAGKIRGSKIILLASRNRGSIIQTSMKRRAVLKGTLGLLSIPALPARASTTERDNTRLLRIVGEILIPTSITSGGGARDVTDFVVLAISHGLRGAKPDLVDRLENELDRHADGAFQSAPFATQKGALEALDTTAYSPGAPGHSAWPLVKTLILMSYYTSEVGGSQELDYELAPGRFDADVPVRSGTKALSNDWSGVTIRKTGPN